MSSQNNREDNGPVKAAIVGVLALLTALFGGFFLILNTLVEKDTNRVTSSTSNVPFSINTTWSPSTQVPTITLTPNIPLTITAISIEEYPLFTLYWDRALWENAIRGNVQIEDFEKDRADYGELKLPYLTGNGFLLSGRSTAQIFRDPTLINDGNLVHFRDWETGLTFRFPNSSVVSAFSFDYKASETWQLQFADAVITIPEGRNRFLGIVMKENFQNEFNLYSLAHAQGGLTIDNIAYIPADSH
jgi:hypothetical protein